MRFSGLLCLCGLCLLGLAPRARAQADAALASKPEPSAPAAPVLTQPSAPAQAPAASPPPSAASAPAVVKEPVATPAPATEPAHAQPQPADAAVSAGAPAEAPGTEHPKRAPLPPPSAAERAAAHDAERPPVPPKRVEEPEPWPVLARLTLGAEGSLWLAGDNSKQFTPVTTAIDLGYVLSPELAILVRGSTWLRAADGHPANEFLGAGASYRFAEESMYATGVLGLGIARYGGVRDFQHYVQGVTLQADFGETWRLSDHSEMALGAQFQIGTPIGGTKVDAFTSLSAGIFLALGLR